MKKKHLHLFSLDEKNYNGLKALAEKRGVSTSKLLKVCS